MTSLAMKKYVAGEFKPGLRQVAEEVPIAIVHDGATHAVMMATADDLEDFAVGFSISEGVIGSTADIRELDIVRHDTGVELRLWLQPSAGRLASERRRLITGPTGCGLCGIDSIEAACKPARLVASSLKVGVADIQAAVAGLAAGQGLGKSTRATHGAGFYLPGRGVLAVREDVGRHNALDKLIGYVVREEVAGTSGIVAITSRVSVEMVQKTAVLGAPILVAVSAPTSLAVATAEAAGITLVAVARDDGFEIFSHTDRIAI